jgi:rfaE bifunctional protein kinase chain/domain/rfaE bifunctional protein nucleotidyltransferase chain/domain
MMTSAEELLFERKIKTPAQLREILGPAPRDRKVIMCHGTFDLVHPGHVRHLIYAKSKAPILVTSLTSDAFIEKGNHRPFVPQELRAMNLAALEVVDYVVIDNNAKPLENLAIIQPDYFAKGYEYNQSGIHPKTLEEKEVIESYGGELLFTPGDIVYSSSAIIESGPPNLAHHKLSSLMHAEGVTFNDLRRAVDSFETVKIHVIGDTIVDSYSYCTLIGGNTKTPTFSVKFDRQVDFVGGAGIVSKHMRKAKADVTFTTVLGDDALKDFVLNDLEKNGVRSNAVIDPTRPTTQKNLFTAGGYRLLKVDSLDNRSISEKILATFSKQIAETKSDAVVFSDFRHGIFNPSTIPQLTEAIPAGPLRIADTQVATRWGNILDFQGFDLITPNEREARFALGDQDSIVRPLALELFRRTACKYLILKLGERGNITYRAPDHNVRSFFTLDSFTENLVDAVGAGDALLAYATLALTVTGNPLIASILGSVAAALACERDGNIPIEPTEVLSRLDRLEKQTLMQPVPELASGAMGH